jgi:anaerobic glycerol-3-phosphate dehydrogenase
VKILVVGAGFAGVAAAFAAHRAGASVTVVSSSAGSSALYAGAVDGQIPPAALQSKSALVELGQSLGLRLREKTQLATREGVVRAAAGSDSALLDLAPLAGKRIAVVDVMRDDWDARLLAKSFATSDWARETGTRFERTPLDLLEKSHQRRISSYDFAASFERAERPAWLAEVLKAHAGPDAWLFGPWLGVRRHLAEELSADVGVPVGEVTSAPGGVAGARFEARRDALLATLRLELITQTVARVVPLAGGVSLTLADGVELHGDALVLASGGFVSGSLELCGALSGAEPAGFELAIAGLPPVQVRGELAGPVSSLFGVDLATRGRRLLERVGLPVEAGGAVVGVSRVFAAGDVLAPEPPGVAHALLSGLLAGATAAASGA